jgi:predicted O-methyltransferase YrrM
MKAEYFLYVPLGAKYESPAIQGWMTERELQWLYDMARQMNSIVEVGSWRGLSTHALLAGCRGAVYAVDTWEGSPNELNEAHADAKTQDIYEQFLANVGMFKNLIPIRKESAEAAKLFAHESIDMVWIDGCHMNDYVKSDYSAWFPKCRKLICGHDLDMPAVKKALDEMGVYYKRPVDTIWSFQKERG